MSSNQIGNFCLIFMERIQVEGNMYDLLYTQSQSVLAKPNVLEYFASSKIKHNAVLDTQPSNLVYKNFHLHLCFKTVQLLSKLACITPSWIANILFISSQHDAQSPTLFLKYFCNFP